MELSKRSWHFRIHKLVYGKNARLPTNLCPYFWKTIVFGLFWIMITLPIAIPTMIVKRIVCLFVDEDEFLIESVYDKGLFSSYLGAVILVDFLLTMLYSMIAIWFLPSYYDKDGNYSPNIFQMLGMAGYVIIGILLIFFLVEWIKDRKQERKYKKKEELRRLGKLHEYYSSPVKVKEPSIIWEAVKAWYKKNCPVIKWK